MSKKSALFIWMFRTGVVLGIIVLCSAAFAIYKESQKKKQVQAVIDQLSQEAEKIGKENRRMEDNLEFLSSVDYLEIEAKDKLNRKNADEQVVVMKTNATKKEQEETTVLTPAREEKIALANHVKWWNYFFKY